MHTCEDKTKKGGSYKGSNKWVDKRNENKMCSKKIAYNDGEDDEECEIVK